MIKLFEKINTDKYMIIKILFIKITFKKKPPKSDIDAIVWWIPFKSLRNAIRNIYNLYSDMYKRFNDLYFLNLKNVFSEKMLNILSLKDYSMLNEEIYHYWFRYGVTNDFLDLLYLVSKRDNIWDKINHNFWLIYISSLIEQNNFGLAEDILIKYIEKYKFLDIHRFPFVSKFSKQMGITNNDIEKTVFISNKLDESIENKIFENAIKGKSVAVVGNGPQELGKGKGYKIDSYDIVIRFNNFNTNGFEKDYGSKTDIFIRNGSMELKDVNRQFNKICVWEPDFYHFIIPQYILDRLYADIVDNKFQTTYLNYEMHNIPKIESGIKTNLTSGTLIIYFLFKINKISINDIYGFSFIKNDYDSNSYHYYPDKLNYGDASKWHEINNEILFLRKLFNLNENI